MTGQIEQYLEQELATLRQQLAEAQRDTERLNYLEQFARCDPKMDGQHLWWSINPRPTLKGSTLRAAIDKAIESLPLIEGGE